MVEAIQIEETATSVEGESASARDPNHELEGQRDAVESRIDTDLIDQADPEHVEPDVTDVPPCDQTWSCRLAPHPLRTALLPLSLSILVHGTIVAIALAIIFWTPHLLHLAIHDPGYKDGDSSAGDGAPIGALIETSELSSPMDGFPQPAPIMAAATLPPSASLPLEEVEQEAEQAPAVPPQMPVPQQPPQQPQPSERNLLVGGEGSSQSQPKQKPKKSMRTVVLPYPVSGQ